jgi:hypothetical protein
MVRTDLMLDRSILGFDSILYLCVLERTYKLCSTVGVLVGLLLALVGSNNALDDDYVELYILRGTIYFSM